MYRWHLFQLQSLQSENISLRRQVTTNIYQVPCTSDYPDPSSPSALKRRQSAGASRPMSMYETGSGLKPYLPKGETPYPEEGLPTLQPFPPHVSKTCSLLSFAISSPLPDLHDFPFMSSPCTAVLLSSLAFYFYIFFLLRLLLGCTAQHQRQCHQKAPCHVIQHGQLRSISSRFILKAVICMCSSFAAVLFICPIEVAHWKRFSYSEML